VELAAPRPRPTKSRRTGLVGAWDKVTSTVDQIVHDVQDEEAGGVSGAHAVQEGTGVDVEVPAGSTVHIRLAEAVTVTRARTP
jgi:anti-sigma factor RsiW